MKTISATVILFYIISWKFHLVDCNSAKCPIPDEPPFTVNIPHETECGKFYICQKNKKIEVSCPSFLEFNAKIQICDWPQKANCSLKSKNTKSSDPDPDCFNAGSTLAVPTGKMEADCIEDQYLPHESNCSLYYQCVYGKKVLKTCPRSMRFNNKLVNCDFHYNVQCNYFDIEDRIRREEVSYEDDFLNDYIEAPKETDDDTASEEDREYWEDFLNGKLEVSLESGSVDYLKEHGSQKLPDKCPEVSESYEPILLPHEKKCNAYYKCSDGQKQLLFCPGMLQFNPKVQLCDLPTNVKCIERKVKTSEPSATKKSQLSVCPQIDCQNSTIYLPSKTNIRQFIRCENGRQVYGDCPNGLVFDVKLKVCNLVHLAETI